MPDARRSHTLLRSRSRSPFRSLSRAHGAHYHSTIQINLLRPGLLGQSKLHFAMAYCPQHSTGWDRPGGGGGRGAAAASVREGACLRPWELNVLLRATVMIRRLKAHVMAQLPPKRRQLVPIHVSARDALEAGGGPGAADGTGAAGDEVPPNSDAHPQAQPVVDGHQSSEVGAQGADGVDGVGEGGDAGDAMTTYRLVGMCKVRGGIEWLLRLLKARMRERSTHDEAMAVSHGLGETGAGSSGGGGERGSGGQEEGEAGRDTSGLKFVVFGHHRSVLDRIHGALLEAEEERVSEVLRGRGVELEGEEEAGGGQGERGERLPGELKVLRIDGATPPRQRVEVLERFRTAACAAVVIISVTAGGQGVDLSCASVGVFFEIPPDCGWVRQAEDRLHRKGQHSPVLVHYLVAHDALGALPEGGASRGGIGKGKGVPRGRRGTWAAASVSVASLAEFDARRWGSVCRMIRAIGDVTDGPALSQPILVENSAGDMHGAASGGQLCAQHPAPESVASRSRFFPPATAAPSNGHARCLSSSSNALCADSKGGREGRAGSSYPRLWFQVSRYSGRLHVLHEEAAAAPPHAPHPQDSSADLRRGTVVCSQSRARDGVRGMRRLNALGVTLDAQLLEAPHSSHPAVSDWLQTLPALPEVVASGAAAARRRLTGEEVWAAARLAYRGYLSLPGPRRRALQSGACACSPGAFAQSSSLDSACLGRGAETFLDSASHDGGAGVGAGAGGRGSNPAREYRPDWDVGDGIEETDAERCSSGGDDAVPALEFCSVSPGEGQVPRTAATTSRHHEQAETEVMADEEEDPTHNHQEEASSGAVAAAAAVPLSDGAVPAGMHGCPAGHRPFERGHEGVEVMAGVAGAPDAHASHTSWRRTTPRGEPGRGAALPAGATWREVAVAVGKGGSASRVVTYRVRVLTLSNALRCPRRLCPV